MYISVIPLRHSLSKYPYIYFAPEIWHDALGIGHLIEIPIGKHIVEWIVAKIDISPSETIDPSDIKSIIRVIASIEIIAPYMISMIEEIADRYFLLIHKVASMFLPAPLLTRLDKKNYIFESPPLREYPSEKIQGNTTEIHHYVDSIFQKEDIHAYIKPRTAFIFPDDILLSLFAEKREVYTDEDIALLPTDLTPARRVAAWIDSYSGKYSIIFWTRRLLYYNLSQYENIIYIEDAFCTEQYTYPIKIQNLDILKALDHAGKHTITLVSSTPSLMTLSYFQKSKIIPYRK